MRLAKGPAPLGPALTGLGLWALLASVHCSQDRPSWRYSSSEVVIPKKELGHGKGLHLPGRLSYSLRFGGQRHVIHLWRKNLFWSGQLPVMTQDDQGALQIDYPYVPADCFYLGHLEEIPFSMVTIDTCHGGLDGIMKLDDLAYEIAPLKNSPRFEHTVSQIVADINATGPMYKLGHKEDVNSLLSVNRASEAPRISSFLYSSHPGTLKGHIQAIHQVYNTFKNVSKCITYLLKTFSLVDSFIQSLDYRYLIFLLTIYNNQDPVLIRHFRVPGSPLYEYYLHNFFRPFVPASSTVMTLNGPHESVFQPVTYAMCNEHNMIITSQYKRHYLLLAVINANQQGKMFGLYYDADTCRCQRRMYCIMHPYPGLSDSFSNCSFIHVQHIVSNPSLNQCYYRHDWESKNKTLLARCGDFTVDPGEQCDCGSLKMCYNNPCCETNCRHTSGSICDKQKCCSKCTYTPIGTLCRTIQNICDLPEYCTGKNLHCPSDLYLQNGTPCTEESYCYLGNCTDRTLQCKEIFGSVARDAEETCYNINLNRHRFGHCSRHLFRPLFNPCGRGHQLCGRLQCANITYLPQLQEHVSFHHSIINSKECFGLDTHRSTRSTDVGQVKTGTPCGPGKFCLWNGCKGNTTNLRYDCLPDKCNFRGLCNNRRECHCHRGWDPPLCLNKGAGGSTSGGPPPKESRTIKLKTGVVVYLRVLLGRFYALIAALLLGIATNVRNVKKTVVQTVEVPQPKPTVVQPAEALQPKPTIVQPVEALQPKPTVVKPVEAPQPKPTIVKPEETLQPKPTIVKPVEAPQPKP